jgi:hypothetical protein
MSRHNDVVGHNYDLVRINATTDPLPHEFAWRGVTITIYGHEAGAGYPAEFFNIPIERNGARHELDAFLFQHLSDGETLVFWMLELIPERSTTLI